MKRTVAGFCLAWLLATAPAWAALARVSPVPAPSLPRLSFGVAGTPLQGLQAPLRTAALPAPTLAAPFAPGAVSPEPTPAAAGALASAEAALKGLPAEERRSLPEEILSGQTGRFFDQTLSRQAGEAATASLLASARQATQQAVSEILAKKSAGTKVIQILANTDTRTITKYSGVPDRVEPLQTQGRVYRHWIRNAETFAIVTRTGILKAGPTSYVEFTGGQGAYIKDIYPDLRGVFFTTPDHAAAEARVMHEETPYYIDFEIPEGIAALRLDGNEVLLMPCPPETGIPIRIVGQSR